MDINIGLSVTATGTVDAITCTASPAPASLTDKLKYFVKALGANTSTTPTFAPNGLTARTITKLGGQALVAGDIPRAGAVAILQYDLTNTRWELMNPVYTAGLTQNYIPIMGTGTSLVDSYLRQSGNDILIQSGKYLQSDNFAAGWLFSDSSEGSVGYANNYFFGNATGTRAKYNNIQVFYADSVGTGIQSATNELTVIAGTGAYSGTAGYINIQHLDATKGINLIGANVQKNGSEIATLNDMDIMVGSLAVFSPADSTTTYMGMSTPLAPNATATLRQFQLPNGKITGALLYVDPTSTLGSNEDVTYYLRNITDGTSTLLGTIKYDARGNQLFYSVSISVSSSKIYSVEIVNPAFATNPTNCYTTCKLKWQKA